MEKHHFVTNELKLRKNDWSKDFLKLKQQDDILVFVYGTLRIGGHNYDLLKNEKFLGDAGTVTDSFCMFDTPWSFPVVSKWKSGDRGNPGHIYGELFAVRPIIMLELDRLEGNGTMYQREEKFFWAYDQEYPTRGKASHPGVKAWIYLSVPGYWSRDDLTLCPRSTSKSSNKKYYDWFKNSNYKHVSDEPSFLDGLDDEEPEYGTPAYYEKYYRFDNGRYVEGVNSN